MKEIKAFIRPIKADEVYKALYAGGFCCMTLTDTKEQGLPRFGERFFHAYVTLNPYKLLMKCSGNSMYIENARKEGMPMKDDKTDMKKIMSGSGKLPKIALDE
jgi:nitrogen regulatory protein PII